MTQTFSSNIKKLAVKLNHILMITIVYGSILPPRPFSLYRKITCAWVRLKTIISSRHTFNKFRRPNFLFCISKIIKNILDISNNNVIIIINILWELTFTALQLAQNSLTGPAHWCEKGSRGGRVGSWKSQFANIGRIIRQVCRRSGLVIRQPATGEPYNILLNHA
jgi:hypothetical protein